MSRTLRYSNRRYVAEITSRTLFGLFRLAPKSKFTQEFIGILAEAQRGYPQVELHFFVALSNHIHALATCGNANQLARWLSWTKAAFARAAQLHHAFKGPMWGRNVRAPQQV